MVSDEREQRKGQRPKNGTGSRKACCSYRLRTPFQLVYWEKKTIPTYAAAAGMRGSRPVQRKNQWRGVSRRAARPSAKPVAIRAGKIKATKTRLGSQAASRGTISIFSR